FFSPGTSKNRYVGIWYKKISTGTVVWVANRETPITDKSGMLELSRQGNIIIRSGNNTVIWSSNSTVSAMSRNLMVVVQLLDTGNLVVWDRSTKNESVIWQSFDHPGREWVLTPWRSEDDPSPGEYLYFLDVNGYPQMFVRRGSVIRWRYGPWNGLKFQALRTENPSPIYSSQFVFNEKEIYIKYELKTSVVERLLVLPDDITMHLRWIDQIQEWAVHSIGTATDSCGGYGLCGPYGSCSANSMTLEECEMACRMNCSCTAFANSDIRNGGSGCLLWFDELMDTIENDDKQDLYIKLATSELAGSEDSPSSFNKKKRVVTVVLPTTSAVIVLFAVAYACIKKEKRLHMKEREERYALNKKNNNVKMDDLDELPLFSLNKIVKATNNFDISQKIGEGGFGPVYKGVLEDGREVAVKRLSETSQQGIEEFKNEIICIAKLQHRNLVKLLGYCNHRNELILVYEYMINKSLDLYLFGSVLFLRFHICSLTNSLLSDETRSSMLDWPKRFNIIQGMARGILYLHQDSRLQIIHRDLKAGNILLDGDMNPKISDFGLARKFVGFDTATKTKKVVGTHGYISPEYAIHGRFSIKSDVYSFGVLVLEIVSGKKNREFSHDDHNDTLLG
ncbi:hypothetical protein M8C21_002124, partial [Ambrosia artemisiifolia]